MAVFPFYAEIWGTVSDWIMVCVTALTAWFLWRTLRSQQAVQSHQSSLMQLEFQRYRDSILPTWEFNLEREQILHDNGIEVDIAFDMAIVLKRGQAYDVTVTWNIQSLSSIALSPIIRSFVNTNEGIFFYCSFNGLIVDMNNDEVVGSVIFDVSYHDSMGNHYTQLIEYGLTAGNDNIIRTRAPVLK